MRRGMCHSGWLNWETEGSMALDNQSHRDRIKESSCCSDSVEQVVEVRSAVGRVGQKLATLDNAGSR